MKSKLLLIFITVVLFSFPKENFGQVISLGPDASKFVLYTSSGAVGDNASAHSHITGDVGTLTAVAFVGFGNVNGVMHPGVDAATTACEIDLQATITQINLNPATLVGPLSLGSGATLTPGIYSIPGSATLTLDLILDGQGNPNAEFVFKVAGTLSTNTLSRVKLINGATACHVYWKVDGAVTMAALSTMRGNIISGGVISMGSGDTLEGRAFSTPAGAINIDGITAFTPIGCGSPTLTGPLAPNLGSTVCYTLFSSDGPVSNAGITYVTGDVGTNNTTTTGFNPLFVTGTIHPIPDGSTIAAAADLLNAYNYLHGLPYDIELLYPAQFGNNLVLTPHTYLMNGLVAFTDTVILDAMNDPSAVFVIQVSGAFSTSTYSKVKLINGAVVENVYWVITGAVSISDYSEFEGTIVCANGAMDLLTGVVLHGRAMTTVGALSTAAITAIMPLGCAAVSEPIIVTDPIDQTACVGGSATFSVTATGTNLTYQWRKGSVNLVDGGNISGANTATLTIDPIALSDAATDYNVIVSGTYMPSDTSINVALTIETGPVIITEPVNQTACVGSPVSFSVIATGSSLTYQWRRGIVNLVDGVAISGATASVLTIDPVSALDFANDYNVVITGACAPNATSINVSLTVGTGPVITTEPVNQTACIGDLVSFSVVATGSGLNYQWRKGTVNLIDGGSISGATTDILTIDPVSALDAATDYNVVVSGSCAPNDTSIFVSLTVGTSPTITTEPVDQSVCLGDSATFSVVASGNGLTYQWRKGLVDLVDGANISGATTDTLTIYPVSALDVATDYNVVISGGCAPDVTSINVSLQIGATTIITTVPVSQTVCEGDSVSFIVVASGSNLTYQWRRGTVNLVNGGNISGATSDTLTINPATLSDVATNYNVVISGGCDPTNSLDNNLNSADGFGILAATAITSTGFTEIHNLNVGLYPGVRSSITGFPPAIVVNGAIYAADDVAPPGVAAMLIQAKQDLTDAYLFAEGATAPAPATVAGDQGGLTLAPGIYKSTSTLLIQSGDLTLDAQGDSNAVWIFQIASDFTSIGGAGGNVILSGGALARNVYWQVGSSATIGNGTSFKGTILALTSITMNTGSSIEGRLLARNGAVVLSGTNMITHPTDSVTSIISTTSVNVSLAVNTAPIITTEPISQTACAGDSVSFTVVATGSVLTYQWRKGTVNLIDGGSISGATTDTLTINPVSTLDNATDYNVVITGDCTPNDTSINVSLTVNDSTLIITEPINQTACIGDSVSFVVVATGSNLSYQWRIGNTNIIGATNDTLTINPVGLTDIAIDYNVIVTGLCAPADTSVYVSLLGGTSPVITTQPVSQTVCAGTSASFTVTATGFGLTYQWRKGLFDLSNTGNISGVTTSTLTINPAQLSDTSNSYYVVVSGSCLPSDTSVFVSLNVDTSIVILSEPVSQTVCSGSSVSFTVSAVGSGLGFQWRNGLNDVIDGATISGATTATLTINPVSLADASSNYYVVLTGACLSDTSISVSLIVDTATNITTEPIDQTVCEGNSVSFSVVATGTAISYQWRTGSTDVINSASISGATTNTLTINPVQISVTPVSYYVVVTGACLPNDTSVVATLTINLNPVSIASSNSPVCVGSSVELTAQTETNASYLWNGPNGFISTAQNPVIVSAVLADAGAYSLIVSVVGCTSDTSAITLEINNCVATVELHIPEGFSPDNDGINDVFFIRGLENYPNNSVDVYNRWGNKVFSASPYLNNWDGTSQNNLSVGGDKLPTGTYFILFNLGDDSDIYKGTIYLNRSN